MGSLELDYGGIKKSLDSLEFFQDCDPFPFAFEFLPPSPSPSPPHPHLLSPRPEEQQPEQQQLDTYTSVPSSQPPPQDQPPHCEVVMGFSEELLDQALKQALELDGMLFPTPDTQTMNAMLLDQFPNVCSSTYPS